MTRNQRGAAAAVLAVGLAAGLYFWARGGPPSTASADGSAADWPAGAVGNEPEIPRIDLARLESPKGEAAAGRRDLFDYGVPPPPPPTPPPPPPVFQPPVTAGPPTGPMSVPQALLNVRYVGAIEDKRGLKVAVFLTDRDEVLTGQAGQVVGNRFRIVRIGLESVDIQEVGSDHTRRVALGGK